MKAKNVVILVSVPVLILLAAGLICALAIWHWGWQPRRTLHSVQRSADLRNCDVSKVDLRGCTNNKMIFTFGFDQRTVWPSADKLPPDFVPGEVLTNAMNPGLGIQDLHRKGITGRGVSVAIIDYSILGNHPEYADRLAEVHAVRGARGTSMHGPAVASLLVGRHIGTAPEARLYFLATPDPGWDAQADAEALDWILDKNKTLPPDERIRAVSVSANLSGPGSPFRNGKAWDEAVARAEKAGLLVIDASIGHGFLGPCNRELTAPEAVDRCLPIPTQRGPKLFADRLLVPVAPRTVATEWWGARSGYYYCGWMDHTHGLFGTSWSMPYCVGVVAMGWQVNPKISGPRMKELLFESAHLLPGGEKILDPVAFIAAVKREG